MTWERFAEALYAIKENDLAKKVQEEYCIDEEANSNPTDNKIVSIYSHSA